MLVVDILFPTQYALWRICETTSFIREKNSDILVFKVASHAGIDYNVDYELMSTRQGFENYNIIIFDPNFNFLNKYNKKIDGTKWNGKFPASYLFTRHENFSLQNYALVYHIFLMCYNSFNAAASFPKWRQAIHLYPGGGFLGTESLKGISKKTKIISTHPKTSQDLRSINHPNFIECLGGSFVCKDEKPLPNKSLNTGVMTVAFASMGHAAEKGAEHFKEICERYQKKYGAQGVKFVSIGNLRLGDNIEYVAPMAMHALMDYYINHVDVMISIDTGVAYNGWPLGVESALSGAALFTTDVKNSNIHYKFPSDAITIFETSDLDSVVENIQRLNQNRLELQNRQHRCQEAFSEYYKYENQQGRIFGFLESETR